MRLGRLGTTSPARLMLILFPGCVVFFLLYSCRKRVCDMFCVSIHSCLSHPSWSLSRQGHCYYIITPTSLSPSPPLPQIHLITHPFSSHTSLYPRFFLSSRTKDSFSPSPSSPIDSLIISFISFLDFALVQSPTRKKKDAINDYELRERNRIRHIQHCSYTIPYQTHLALLPAPPATSTAPFFLLLLVPHPATTTRTSTCGQLPTEAYYPVPATDTPSTHYTERSPSAPAELRALNRLVRALRSTSIPFPTLPGSYRRGPTLPKKQDPPPPPANTSQPQASNYYSDQVVPLAHILSRALPPRCPVSGTLLPVLAWP